MKRVFAWATFGAVALGGIQVAGAAPPYNAAGCGLGSMVFKDNDKTQILASTTNSTFGTQTFGITTGTSNCTTDGAIKADKQQEAFVEANLPNLQHDMAAGGGEYLAAFATLLGCDAKVQPDLYAFAQKNYASVFPNDATTPQQALYGFKIQASQQQVFAQSCARL